METDTVGYPKRYAGERYRYNGRVFTIIKNFGLMVLCPCPDGLLVKYDDAVEETIIGNSDTFERIE